MSDTQQDKGVYVPATADLSRFDDAVKRTGGIFIKDIPANTGLEIRAGKDVFTLLVVDPAAGKLKIRGSEYLPELKDGTLNGSTFGGSMLKAGYIGAGMCLEVVIPGVGILRTTAVEQIGIAGQPSFEVH